MQTFLFQVDLNHRKIQVQKYVEGVMLKYLYLLPVFYTAEILWL